MQPELPWNVAGIPSEAREAARAAARREGLSVGEWMTRRIMRGFPEATVEENSNWRVTANDPPPAAHPAPTDPARDTEEMLARVSRSETESQNAYRTIDQQLKTVSRRLENAERNQTENNRAMTAAATQINIAAREQAQAFEQLTGNVTALAERLSRVERQAATDGMREAVKALHQGLSRVADQIAQTASQSAEQIAKLAGNVDSLATQVADVRDRSDGVAEAVEARFASIDERLRVAERTAFSSASAIDHTMENVEQLKANAESLESETRRHGAALSQMKDVFDHLNTRIETAEQQSHEIEILRASVSAVETSVAQTEDAVARLQAQDPAAPLDRRLQSIEHVLSDIMSRLEYSERSSTTQTGAVEQTLRELSSGFEAADRRNRETIQELQSALENTAAKIAFVEEKVSTAAQSAEQHPGQPIFDAPPFPEHTPAHHDGVDLDAPHFAAPPFAADAHDLNTQTPHFTANVPPFGSEAQFGSETPHFGSDEPPPPAFGDAFSGPAIHPAEGIPPYTEAQPESFLAAARRSAQAAAAAQPEQPAPRATLGSFAWTFPGKRTEAADAGRGKRRVVLAGSVFGVAVAAAMTGVVLTRGVGSPQLAATPPATISSPFAARPSLAPSPSADDSTNSPAAAPAGGEDSAAGVPAAPQSATTAAASAPVAAPGVKQSHAHAAATATQETDTQPAATAPAASALSGQIQKLASLANTGDSKGQLLLGLKYLEGNGVAVNEAEAARWLSRAAQQGEPLAQYRLGTLYERGRGVPADPRQATHWYELAAKQGNRKAMHNLAVAFAEGSGEPKDPVSAAMWFSRAANLGLADSQFNLAVLYERGMGVKQSLIDAYKWYLIAAAQGDAESKTRADALSTQLSDTDRAAAQQAAAAFRPERMNPSANSAPVLG